MSKTTGTGQNLSARNPFGNVSKGGGHTKRPLANPFGNLNVRQDNFGADFQMNLSTAADNQGTGLTSPFDKKNQDNTSSREKAFFGKPVLDKRQSYGNITENSGVVHRSGGMESRTDPRGSHISNTFGGQGSQMSLMAHQEPFSNNSFLTSLSTFNNMFGGQQSQGEQSYPVYDENNEPPLLEDLGIDLNLIKARTLAVIKFKYIDEKFAREADMSGPLMIALMFGSLLLLSGKVHFGYIYGFGVIGTVAIYMIMNLLAQTTKARLYNTMSILGYCLLPLVALSFFEIFLNLASWYGFVLSAAAIIWATLAATNFFRVLLNLDQQKYLVAYPILLFYLVFVLITIF